MRLVGWLLDLLYPPKCCFCGRLLEKSQTDLCPKCRARLPYAEREIERGEFFKRCVSVLFYEGAVRESVHRFKFRGKACYAQAYGRLLAMRILEAGMEYDLISWVPVSKRRLRKRGYDQGECIARAAAKELGARCERTLDKVRNNPTQSSRRGYPERRANVLNVYRPHGTPAGKRILLIDDVITSGATLSEASRVLLTAGAVQVECATLAAVREKKEGG